MAIYNDLFGPNGMNTTPVIGQSMVAPIQYTSTEVSKAPFGSAPAPTTSVVRTDGTKTSLTPPDKYAGLLNYNGEIRAGTQAFRDPTQLAGYLGISANQIDWSRIKAAPIQQPVQQPAQPAQPVQQPTPQTYQPQNQQIKDYSTIEQDASKTAGVDTAETAYQGTLSKIMEALTGKKSLSDLFKTEQEKAGLAEKQTQITDLDKQIADKRSAYEKSIVGIEDRQGLAPVLQGRASQQAKLAQIDIGGLEERRAALSGDYEKAYQLAKDNAQAQSELSPVELKTMELGLAEAERQLTDAQVKKSELIKTALEKTQPNLTTYEYSDGKDMIIVGFDPQTGKQAYRSVITGAGKTATSAPTAEQKNYEMARATGYTGTFMEFLGKGADTTVAKGDALTQIKFVQTTLKNAQDLAGASGRSGARKTAEAWFVGSTDYTGLVSNVNTLRTNILSLMVDPEIKKFFGPQMTEKDVELMTSTGTTLNPELQGPDAMKLELGRLEELIQRMADSLGGQNEGTTEWKSPSGNTYNLPY